MRGIRGLGLPRLETLGIDGWVLLYSIGISITIGIAFGVAPALGAARTQPALALRRAGRGTVAPVRERVRATLIIAQVALAAVVVVVAGLLFRSFDRLSQVDPGFALEHGVTFRVAPDWGTYPKREQGRVLFDELLTTLRAMPGSVAVGAVNRLPLTGGWWTTQYEIEGKPAPLGRQPTLLYRVATRDYFTAIGMSLLGGRGLSTSDETDAQRIVVVSRALAERAWPGESAIGRRIRLDPHERAPWYTVVGVVSDVRGSGLADDATPTAYVPLAQATFGHFGDWGMDVVVRTSVDGPSVIAGARRALATIAPAVPLFDARPLSDLVASDLARRRSLVLLLGAFAATAMTLAGLGLYGVVAYGVAQRRGELGVRMALGAGRATVWRSVVARSLGLAGIGVAVGLPGAAAATRFHAARTKLATPVVRVSAESQPGSI